MKTMKLMGRALVAAFILLSAGVVWVNAATTGTNSLQQALYEMFCDACGQPTNTSLRNLVASVVTLQDAQTITGAKTFSSSITASAGITGSNLPYVLGQWSIPVVLAPSGTMANNGAVTWGTALSNAYTGGAWVIMPSGSIAAGVPAATATLWYVGATTTTGTFFNSTYTSGIPTAGTATAFATTGPGAFTGITTEQLAVSLPIAANTLGTKGYLRVTAFYSDNNNATSHQFFQYLNGVGTQQTAAANIAAGLSVPTQTMVVARGSAAQFLPTGSGTATGGWGSQNAAPVYSTQNLANSFTYDFSLRHSAAATDVMVIEGGVVEVMFSN